MAVRFHPLPVDLFSREQAPHIARLNSELSDLFGLEGTIRQPLIVSRSDASIVRRATEQVHISRITPDVASVVSGTSSVIGTPALTFGLLNTVGTTNTVISVDSAIKIFDTTNPADIATSASVGTAAFAARRDHVHNHPALGGDLHTSYILAAGTRAFTGDQSMGGFDLTNITELTGTNATTTHWISNEVDSESAPSTDEGFRINWNSGVTASAGPTEGSKILSIGYTDDSPAFVQIAQFRHINSLDWGALSIDNFDSSGTFRAFLGFGTDALPRQTGILCGPTLMRLFINNAGSFEVSTSAWGIINAAGAQFTFTNGKTTATQAASAFRFTAATTKTAGEYITFENPINTNIFTVDYDGATRVYGERDVIRYSLMGA